jgi:fatty acid desaturase
MLHPLRAPSRHALAYSIGIPLLRYSAWDAIFVAISILPPLAGWFMPSIPVVALGIWWSSNTFSHNFIHLPFFRLPLLNRAYSLYLSLILGFPQTLWRDRHLAHHRSQTLIFRWSGQLIAEFMLVFALWGALLRFAPRFFFLIYIPGYCVGLGLCYIHGYFEHSRGTTSHYGALYNFLFFNDGFHVEHHAHPGEHWKQLPMHRQLGAAESRWSPVLRWLEVINIEALERISVRWKVLQEFLLFTHKHALQRLVSELPNPRRIVVVGGGLFPRTAILLSRMFPESGITIVDGSAENIETAKGFLRSIPGNFNFEHRTYICRSTESADLVVIPLSFMGDRQAIYENPPAPVVLVHDWIWSKRGQSVVVSVLLLKRLNLLRCRH